MYASSSMEDIHEIKPLVSPSPSGTSSHSLTTPSSRTRKSCGACRSRCFLPCLTIAIFSLISCLYVDKEVVVDLGKRSSSFIRKRVSVISEEEDVRSNDTFTDVRNNYTVASIREKKHLDETLSDNMTTSGNGTDEGLHTTPLHTYSPSSSPTKSNSESSDNGDEESVGTLEVETYKQHLVLHLGPQKTGSTTLQTAWYMPNGLSQDLQKDNYRYAFINPHVGYFHCDVSEYGGYNNCDPSPKLRQFIQSAKKSGQNLLLSDENLDAKFLHALNVAIDRKYWHVTVIVVYRRIHEWLVSWYNQINKNTNRDIHGNILFDDFGNPYRMDHKWWPDQGGSEIPSFSDWYHKFTKYFDRSDLVSSHRSVQLVRSYKPAFGDVVVHNMHSEGDLVTNFMCDSLPAAPHCCSRLKRGKLEVPRENASRNLDYDIIAVEARKRSLLQKSMSRLAAQEAISEFVKKKGNIVPRKCNHHVIEEIKGWLLDSEEEMFKESWTESKTSNLAAIFDAYIGNGKLCDVDLDRVFEDKTWLQFFYSMDDRPSLILHVGPPKSGSTTLQDAWASPKELADLLKQDNFAYAKITPEKGMFDCSVAEGKRYANCQATQELRNTIATACKKGQNLLLSDENLNEVYADTLREVIHDKEFKARVVVVYRRIHEWLVSWYNQINKSTNKNVNGEYLKDESGHLYREEHKYFPEEGGVAIPSFVVWYKQFTSRWEPAELVKEHPSIHFMNVYTASFSRVEVYNMHKKGDFVTNFMCQMIPEAEGSCKALNEGIEVPVLNPSMKLDYDIIAVAAFERGLVRRDITRTILRAAVTFFMEKTEKSVPRICDTAIIEEIRSWLFESERIILKDYWDESHELELGQTFSEYQNKGELCEIDLESILADEELLDFLDSLKLLDFQAIPGYETGKLAIDDTSGRNGVPKPFLTLHVGPQKTGSSTLQTAWSIMNSELEQDNYAYQHVSPEHRDFICDVGRWGGFTNCKASETLKALIEETHRAGRNLLLSDENLDERFAQPLRDAIDDSKWHVTVVVTYRRIDEWLFSWYNQINKTTNRDAKGNVLIDENGDPYREEHSHWPDEGGDRIPSFSSWYQHFTDNWEPSELVQRHRSVEFFNLYAPLFDNVVIYDMHQDGDLVTNFMCDVIPRTDHSCISLKNEHIQLPTVNPSIDLEYDIVSVFAYDRGYVDKSLSRRQVVEAVTKFAKDEDKSLPRVCHPEITKQIHDWLIASEEVMFADSWTPKRSMEATESFKKFFDTGKMCDVDWEEVLRDQDWVNFFHSLSRRAHM